MKMVIDINLDRIFQTVEDADWQDAEYKILKKKEPHGDYEARRKWKWDCDYRYKESDKANESVWSILSTLNMDQETQCRLRIAIRAKQRWEKKINFMRLPSEKMMKQLANFIFDNSKNDPYGYGGFIVKKRWWDLDDDVYEREIIK